MLAQREWRLTSLYLLGVTAPLEVYRTDVGGLDVSLFRLSLLIMLFVALSRRSGIRELFSNFRNPLAAIYTLFLAVLLLAVLAHPINVFLGGREAAQVGIGVATIILIVQVACGETIERVCQAIAVGAVLPILAGAWQGISPKLGGHGALPLLDHLPAAPGLEVTRQALAAFGPIGTRAKGTFGDPNHFGIYLLFVISLAAALALRAGFRGDRRRQVSFGALTVAAVATLVATFSRSAWMGAAVVGVIMIVGLVDAWRVGPLRRPRTSVAVFLAVAAVGLFAAVAPSVAERIAPGSRINALSDQTHGHTVRFAFDQFVAHPLLGIGPGGIGIRLHQGSRTSGAHSSYLTFAAELGVPGLFVLLLAAAFTVRLLITLWRSLRGTPNGMLAVALGAAYAGYLAGNVTYDVWLDDFHWLVLGSVAASAAKYAVGDDSRRLVAGLAAKLHPRFPAQSARLATRRR